MFRLSTTCTALLLVASVAAAQNRGTGTTTSTRPAATPRPASRPAATSRPAPTNSAYVCNSKIGGTVPQVGPVHHSSVAVCPPGQKPTVIQSRTSVNNPNCTYYGTRPGTSTFQVESKRIDVSCKPAQAPASVVQQRVNTFNQPYNVFTNNCQHAASKATKK